MLECRFNKTTHHVWAVILGRGVDSKEQCVSYVTHVAPRAHMRVCRMHPRIQKRQAKNN